MLFSLAHVSYFAQQLARRMYVFPQGGRIVFLQGEMGTGKTTIAKTIAEYFGVSTLTSPTFTFLQEYLVEDFHDKNDGVESRVQKIIHIDLHRADENRVTEIIETIEESFSPEYIYLIEWAPKLLQNYFSHLPAFSIDLSHPVDPHFREIEILFYNPNSVSVLKASHFLSEFFTPVHVQRHISMVQKVAIFCAQKLKENYIPIDVELVESGAILHDCLRYTDFKDLENFENYEEEITEEKLKVWKHFHTQYQKTHHADAMADILQKRGYSATAQVVQAHNTASIYKNKPFSWEELCVHYADKRVLHDTIVSLESRLLDGRVRYAYEHSPHLEEKLFALEKDLFTAGNILPEEISELSCSSHTEI